MPSNEELYKHECAACKLGLDVTRTEVMPNRYFWVHNYDEVCAATRERERDYQLSKLTGGAHANRSHK